MRDSCDSNGKNTSRYETRFTLRINTALLNAVKEEAKRTKRSTAQLIVHIIQNYFDSIEIEQNDNKRS